MKMFEDPPTPSQALKDEYEALVKVDEKILNISEENHKQIMKDLARTYPSYKAFKSEKTQKKLENILRAFSNKFHDICYFQGMNFIVGFFLYHCEEYIAYEMFVAMFEECEMRNLFTKGFPGLQEHTKNVKKIVETNYSDINYLFTTLKVNLEIVLVEWLYSLFSSTIPLEVQYDFYFGFINQKWDFFYKMCISCFLELEGKFNEADDVYIALKFDKHRDDTASTTAQFWKGIIKRAYSLKFK